MLALIYKISFEFKATNGVSILCSQYRVVRVYIVMSHLCTILTLGCIFALIGIGYIIAVYLCYMIDN